MPTIETLRAGDIPQRDALARLAFGMPEPLPAERPQHPAERSVGAYDGDRLVANVTTLPDGHWFGGAPVAAGGVTTVVVAPDQRGRNLARLVVSEAIRRVHAHGAAVSALYPTTATLYRGLGYEVAAWYRSTDVPIASLASLRPPPDVVVEPGDHDDVEAAYDATAPQHDGWLRRSEHTRSLVRFDHDHLGAPKATFRARRGGTTVGALVYSEVAQGHLRPFDLVATQLVATDAGALRALLAVAGAHGTLGDSLRTFLPPDQLALAVPHAQRLVPVRQFPAMFRVVDVVTAVAQRGYVDGIDIEVHLDITGDDIVAANNGRFVLRVRDGKGELSPGGAGTVAVDIRELAAAYTGFATSHPALRLAFSGPRPPWWTSSDRRPRR